MLGPSMNTFSGTSVSYEEIKRRGEEQERMRAAYTAQRDAFARQVAGGGPEVYPRHNADGARPHDEVRQQRDSLREYKQARHVGAGGIAWSPDYKSNGVMENVAYDAAGALHMAAGGISPNHGTAQMPRAPGKMFPRSDYLAIIRAERTKWFEDGTATGGARYRAAMEVLGDLARIIENLE